jgi:hypothetical protein
VHAPFYYLPLSQRAARWRSRQARWRHGRNAPKLYPERKTQIRIAPHDALNMVNSMDEYVPHNAPQRDPVTVSGGFPTPAKDSRGRQSPFSDCALAKLPRGQHEPRLAKLEPNSLCSWLSATAAVRSSNGARRWVSSLPEEED